MRNHIYEHDEIVIGSDLSALLYAYFNDSPIVFTDLKKPEFFEYLDIGQDFGHGVGAGISKTYVWARLIYLLSLSGLVPLSDNAVSIRAQDNNTLKITTEHSRLIKFKYNKLVVFDDENLYGVKFVEKDTYEVLDWMNVRSGMVHQYDKIQTASDFVNHIYFYPSRRIDGQHNKKDLVAVSYLTHAQLQDFEYSDTYARFKVEQLMRENGIKGRRNGRDTNNPDLYKYYSIKVEAINRQINKSRTYVSNCDNIEIATLSDEQIIKANRDTGNLYIRRLLKYFNANS